MPSSFTRNLGLEKPATGEQAGTWGETADKDYDLIDAAVDGNQNISIGGGYNLNTAAGSASDGRNKVIIWNGTLTADATINITPNTAEKLYIMQNATSGGFSLIFSQGTGGTYTLRAGASAIIYCDGAGATARVAGAFYNPQFDSMVLQSQLPNSTSIRAQATDIANNIQFWKDTTPTIAAAIGLNVPGTGLTSDLIFSTLAAGAWTERLRIRGDGNIDVHAILNASQREVVNSNIVNADYTAAAIQLRETNQVGNAQTDNTYSPRLAFHWAGVAARQIGMDSTGALGALNGDGTAGDFYVRTLYAGTSVSTALATVTTVNATTVNATTVNAVVVTAATVTNVTTLNATNWNGSYWNGYSLQNPAAPPTPSQVITSDGSSTVNLGWINTVSGDSGGAAITRVYASSDQYIRFYTLANFAAQIAVLIPPTPQTPWLSDINVNGHTMYSGDGIVRIQPGNQFLQSTQGEIPDALMGPTGLQFFTFGVSQLWVKFRDISTGNIIKKAVSVF
jgi:hypothetical protein